MRKLAAHIEQLLQHHDCVIVPGIGGFVLSTVPAALSEEDQLFRPMRKEVLFNATLQHNDGLLTESYMKSEQLDFNQARIALERDIQSFRQSLQPGEKVPLGRIGAFVPEKERRLVFYPSGMEWLNPGFYGLPSFHIKPLSALPREEVIQLTQSRRERDTIYIPVSKKLLKGIAASAAAVALFLMVSTPVKDVDRSTYTASFIPVELLSESLTSSGRITQEEVAEFPGPEIVMEAEVSEQPVIVPVKTKKYHVVIGSFVTHKQADDFIEKIDRNLCKGIDRIVRDERIRVYADKFDDREEAELYLESLRQHEKYKDAWLFISR